MAQATSPGFKSKSSSHTSPSTVPKFQGRSKRPPPSQGFSSMHWVKLHNSLQEVAKYGGPKMYPMDEVKKHNKRNDCWMVLNGHVFDITKYVPYHPGGDEILKGKGRDATVLFYQVHRWVNIEALIKNCWIGQVVDYKPPDLKKVGKTKSTKIKSRRDPKKKEKVINGNERNRQMTKSRTQKLMQQRSEMAKKIIEQKKDDGKGDDGTSLMEQKSNDEEITKLVETVTLAPEKEEDLEALE